MSTANLQMLGKFQNWLLANTSGGVLKNKMRHPVMKRLSTRSLPDVKYEIRKSNDVR